MTLADRLADFVTQPAFFGPQFHGPRIQIMADAAGAVMLLIVKTDLSVYKPPGMTAYGLRKQHAIAIATSETGYVAELDKTASFPL